MTRTLPDVRARRGASLLAAAALCAGLVALPAAADDRREDAADLVRRLQQARVIDLSHTWDEKSPIASVNPPYSFELIRTHENTRGTFGDGGQLSFAAEDMHFSGQHGAPSIDAIGHIGRDGKLFGGVDAAASTSNPLGIGRSGVGAALAIDRFPEHLMLNRGVLLDVASLIMGSLAPLPGDFEITAAHLRAAEKAHGVRIRKGDTVFIRTGWGQYFAADPDRYAGASSPGPGLDGAEYLIKQGARIVGNDTLTFEKRPPITTVPIFQVFPVHMRLIADSGIFIIENLDLERLAAAKIYEFPVVVPPLKIRGGSGSAIRVFAIVPRRD